MIRAFGLAFAQLFDRRILKLAILSILITLAVYGGLIAALVYGMGNVHLAAIPWLDTLARWSGGIGAVLLAALFFPGAVSAVMSLWQDQIIDAVERRYYPALPPAPGLPAGTALAAALRLLGLTVLLNLALLPVYLALVFVPPMNAVLFALANGALLGREYFDAVALRRMSVAEAAVARRAMRSRVWMAGTLSAVILTVPGLNLIAPVLATMAFTHLVQTSYSKN
jgi:uncharacterized protein involved in cysteine biosynthesis